MSTIHIVKVTGTTRKELIKALQAAIAELGGEEVISTRKVSIAKEVQEEEYEEVTSPFATSAPILDNQEEDLSGTTIHGELDAQGIPWDKRIHSSSKARYKNDNTWKLARGISDAQAAPVIAELKNKYAHITVVQEVPTFAPVIAQNIEAVQSQPVVQLPPVVQVPPMLTMNHGGHTLDTFRANFALVIAQLITEGKIDQVYVNSLKDYFKLNEIWMASAEQQELVFNQLVEYKKIQKVG